MLKKILVATSILSLFVGIFMVQAQTKIIYHFEDQYIDALNIPWTKSVKDMEENLNRFYDKPEGSGKWTLECGYAVCHPFYMYEGDKHIMKTYYVFGSKDQLRSITAQYENVGYERLIQTIENHFDTRGVITAEEYAHHIYEKEYRGAHIAVEVIKKGTHPITFTARFKNIKDPKGDNKDGDIALSNPNPSILHGAPMRAVLAYCILRSSYINF